MVDELIPSLPFPAYICLLPVRNEDIPDIKNHVVPDGLIQDILIKSHFRTLALHHHHRRSLTVIDDYISPEHLVPELETSLTHHHVHGHLAAVGKHSDTPLTHLFFRSKSHLLPAKRIPYDHSVIHILQKY